MDAAELKSIVFKRVTYSTHLALDTEPKIEIPCSSFQRDDIRKPQVGQWEKRE